MAEPSCATVDGKQPWPAHRSRRQEPTSAVVTCYNATPIKWFTPSDSLLIRHSYQKEWPNDWWITPQANAVHWDLMHAHQLQPTTLVIGPSRQSKPKMWRASLLLLKCWAMLCVCVCVCVRVCVRVGVSSAAHTNPFSEGLMKLFSKEMLQHFARSCNCVTSIAVFVHCVELCESNRLWSCSRIGWGVTYLIVQCSSKLSVGRCP